MRKLFALAAVMAIGHNPSASGSPAVSKARAVIAASKLATGGPAWNRLSGSYEEGTHADGALPYKTWLDFRAYGMRLESRRGAATTIRGFNGRTAWQTGPDGTVRSSQDPGALEEAVLNDYVSVNGYYFPGRFPASFRYLRKAKTREGAFDVVEITPKGSRPFDIWFDRATHTVRRIDDRHAAEPSAVEAGDYRRVDGVLIPFKLTVTGPGGAVLDRGAVTTLQFRSNEPVRFDPPKGP